MRPPSLLAAAIILTSLLAASPAEAADVEHFAGGLDWPVSLAFDGEGRLFFAELKTGFLRVLHANGSISDPWASVDASPGDNGGFLGVATDPDEVGVIYAYYTIDKENAVDGKVNRVVKLVSGEETVLLDDIPWAALHDGGRVAVGADGYLYATMGDAQQKESAQDSSTILGKILRMTRDGAPAPDNPDGWHPYAFAKGFRNPFGIVALPDGRIYVSDNGDMMEMPDEEVNLLEKGGNYGWPSCTGPCDAPDTVDPVASWDKNFGPTGIDVHDEILYLGDFVYGLVRTVDLRTGEKAELWHAAGEHVLDVAVGPDGCLYVATMENVYRMPLGSTPCELPLLGPPAYTGGDDEDEVTGGGASLPDNGTPGPALLLVLFTLAVVAASTRRRA